MGGFFSTSTITRRLLAVFGTVLLIFAVFGALAMGRVQTMGAATDMIVKRVIPTVVAAQDIDRQIMVLEQTISVLRTFDSAEWLGPYRDAHSHLLADYKTLAALDAQYPTVRSILEQRVQPAANTLDAIVRGWLAQPPTHVRLSLSAQRPSSTAGPPPVPPLMRSWNSGLAVYRKAFRDLSASLDEVEAKSSASSNGAASSAFVTITVCMAAGFALVALLALGLLRTVKAANADLLSLAKTDSLTGRPNHRTMVELLDREIARGSRNGLPCSVLVIDIDHFKAVNDTYGHLAGDAALQAFADRVVAEIRRADIVGRWGGEEFVVILPEIQGAAAMSAADRIRSAIAANDFNAAIGKHLTCSIGIASFPVDGVSSDVLIGAADHAMYAAKQMGRNQVRLASDTDSACMQVS